MGSDVVIYSSAGCMACVMTARMLTKQGVAFEVVRVDEDAQAAALLRAMGFTQVPVVFTGEEWWSGFRPDLLKGLSASVGTL